MTPKREKLSVNLYRTNVGNFFQINTAYGSVGISKTHLVNGIPLSDYPTVKGWSKIDGEISSIQLKSVSIPLLTGYVLKYKELANHPEFIPLNEVDTEYEPFHPNYDLALYSPLYSESKEVIEDLEFDIHVLGDYVIEDPFNLKDRKIQMRSDGSFDSKVLEVSIASIANYDDIVNLLTPEFAKAQVKCHLTSKQVYQIVRQHIIANLDYAENVITSNYDFCFTVKKRVHTKPFLTTETYFVGKSNKTKTKSVTKTEKEIEVFEMSWAGYKGNGGYGSYSCISPITADNIEELYEKVTSMLDKIIADLNTRVNECECCGGAGYNIVKAATP